MREPDLMIHKPMDIWVLAPGEEPPEGAAVHQTAGGVRLAFRPARIWEAYNGTDIRPRTGTISTIQ